MSAMLEPELDILVYWMHERRMVRERRLMGMPPPWTQDPLMRDYRWCNVRRMDDAVSQALLGWYPASGSAVEEAVACALARTVNYMDSLNEVTRGERFRLEHRLVAAERLRAREARGEKVFTGAYIIPGISGMAKIDSVLATVSSVYLAANRGDVLRPTMRATWEQLRLVPGLGSFLAGQIAADLAQLSAGMWWPDLRSWAPVGPGSARGVNRLHGRELDYPVAQALFEAELDAVIGELRARMPARELDGLIAMDIQNCLCEYDKFRRLALGQGTVRARYVGKSSRGSLLP